MNDKNNSETSKHSVKPNTKLKVSVHYLPCEMASPESCCAAGFATVSDIGGHYSTAYGQSILLIKQCVIKGQKLKICRLL
jgi:hypothetical protein